MCYRYQKLLDHLSEAYSIPMTTTFTTHITNVSHNNSSSTIYQHISTNLSNTTFKHSKTTIIVTSTITLTSTFITLCVSITLLQYPKAENEFTHITIVTKSTPTFQPSTIPLPNSETRSRMSPQSLLHDHKSLATKSYTRTPNHCPEKTTAIYN